MANATGTIIVNGLAKVGQILTAGPSGVDGPKKLWGEARLDDSVGNTENRASAAVSALEALVDASAPVTFNNAPITVDGTTTTNEISTLPSNYEPGNDTDPDTGDTNEIHGLSMANSGTQTCAPNGTHRGPGTVTCEIHNNESNTHYNGGLNYGRN